MSMFGHLKAEDFTNLVEGDEAPAIHRTHLQSCTRCMDAFVSAQGLHSEMMKSVIDDQDIPEPDWFQFRNDVRTSMLSRAAQRQSKTATWSGWFLRPAMTWGLAVAFTAGLTAGLFLWNEPSLNTPFAGAPVTEQIATFDASDTEIVDEASMDSAVIDLGMTTWPQTSVFDEYSQLSDAQAEKLQRLLEADAVQAPAIQ
jgi:hypothetical protein